MAKSVGKTSIWDGLEPKDKNGVDTHTHTHTDTHDDNDVYEQTTVKKTTKNKRIQILTYSALVRKMDNYAKRNGLSRAEVFEKAVSDFLERNT